MAARAEDPLVPAIVVSTTQTRKAKKALTNHPAHHHPGQ
jgi:hypothetical protein